MFKKPIAGDDHYTTTTTSETTQLLGGQSVCIKINAPNNEVLNIENNPFKKLSVNYHDRPELFYSLWTFWGALLMAIFVILASGTCVL